MGRIGTGGRVDRELDQLALSIDAQLSQINTTMQQMMTTLGAGPVGAALPATSFIQIPTKGRNKGVRVSMAFYIDENTTKVKCEIIALKDNVGSDKAKIHAAVLESVWDDITDDERSAKYIIREFSQTLEFNTIYKVTRTVARNEGGTTAGKVLLPIESDSPYKNAPITAFVDRYNPDRSGTGLDACFQTGSSEDPGDSKDNCGGAEVGAILPKPDPVLYNVGQKVNSKGVKPLLRFIVHVNTRQLRVALIKKDDIDSQSATNAFKDKISHQFDIDKSQLSFAPLNEGTDARLVTLRFPIALDSGVIYETVLIVSKGDNVGGIGTDEIRNPGPGLLSVILNGEFTAGSAVEGGNANLRPDMPFVQNLDLLPTPTPDGKPDGYVIKKNGCRALMNFIIPIQTTKLGARIVEKGKPNQILSDDWDDISDAERTSDTTFGKCTRQFGPKLDFKTTYQLVRLFADGTGIGIDGQDRARLPDGALANPPVALVEFTTPDEDGTFSSGTSLDLRFVGVTRAVYKKNGSGVIDTFKIEAPKGTNTITARILKVSDNAPSSGATQAQLDAAKAAIIEATFTDCSEEIATSGFIERAFPIKLDIVTTPGELNYGVVRLIAEGSNINPSGTGGSNTDIFRNPKTKPVAPFDFKDNGNTIKTFSTAGALSFGNATIPAIPVLADLTNSIENDEAKVSFRVYFSATGQGGSGTGGRVTASDIGMPTEAFVICNRAGQAGDTGTVDKQKFSVPISDPLAIFADIELEGLKTGKQYYIPRVGITNGTETKRTSAAIPLTSILFRAGFEIDLTTPTNITAFAITQPLAIDSRSSQVPISYTVAAGKNVLPRNLVVEKDVIKNSVATGYKEFARLELKNDQDNASQGVHNFNVQSTHPANTQIRYRATLNPVKGGAVSSLSPTLFPANGTYDMTADDPGVTDTGPPHYQNKIANLKCRFRPDAFNINFRLPDQNMFTHLYNVIGLRFSTVEQIFTNVFNRNSYYLNPKDNTVTPFGFGLGVPSPITSPNSFTEIGKSSEASLGFERPTVPAGNDGDFAGLLTGGGSNLMSEFRRISALPGSSVYLEYLIIIVNQFNQFTMPFPVPYTIVTSTQIPFNNGNAAGKAFQGLATTGVISEAG